MRIGIIGQPCIDENVGADGTIRAISPGGILYSYGAMERVMADAAADCFVPLSWDSRSDRKTLHPIFDRLTHMDRSVGLWPTDALTNRVQLIYSDESSRKEYCANVLPPLASEQLTPELLSTLDGLFINMISGFDITLSVLQSALSKANPRPYTHIDIHALVLGELSVPTEHGTHTSRRPRGVPEWQEWLAIADSVQMNEFEVRWIGDPKITNEEDVIVALRQMRTIGNNDCHGHQREPEVGEELGLLPNHVIITRAERGASIYDFSADQDQYRTDIPAPPVVPRDTTGSGDVFGAIFTYWKVKKLTALDEQSSADDRSSVLAATNATMWASNNTIRTTPIYDLSE